uniref:Large ribosomal subunit protein uL16m n=1 Tax=Symbiochloris sp. SG-2018 TaxID=2126034 RepID=A0A976U614_9CHLO|nr:ribosomal protein L16 [Symbiochloris sp. SG-2018]UVF37871.1 ribosomal protein L16 [Symbiochloris sp. SG-2018]
MSAKTKFRKVQKGKIGGIQSNTYKLKTGKFGIKALKDGYLTIKHLDVIRRSLSRSSKRSGQFWVRVCTDKPMTSKPKEVRMGKGKGSVTDWAARIKSGQILYEFDGVKDVVAEQILQTISPKLPFPIKLMSADKKGL